MRRRRPAALAILLSLIAGACSQAPASDAWPRQSVRLVVPFGAGTGTDLAARLLAPRLADRWGTSVIVDNRPGSDGVIGTQAFVSAKDDHVLLFTPAGPLTVSPFLHERLPYDPARDLVPISSIGSPSIVIAVAASVAATSISELVDVVRRHEREYRWAAVAGVPELVFKAFVQLERLEVTHVAYRDMSTALQDLGRGRIHVMVASLPTVWPQINAGAARPLAVTNSVRAPSAPHVATAAEAGYPALTVDGLWGFFGWDGISDALRRKLAADIAQAAADRPLVERLSAIGLVVRTGSPDEFAAAVDRQRIQVTSVAAILGLTRGTTAGGSDVRVR